MKSLDFGRKFFNKFLDGFISQNVDASKFFTQLDLEGVPDDDVVKETLLVQRDGLERECHFHSVVAFG